MRKIVNLILLILLLTVFALPASNSSASVSRQDTAAVEKALRLLDEMTPEERVGQLFLVSFEGSEAKLGTQIYDLITKKHIGGVILRSDNNNFIGPENSLSAAQNLIAELQKAGTESGQTNTADQNQNRFIPLLIGINQENNQGSYDQILNGMTELPDQMAIGATWQTGYSQTIGTILGSELNILGFNLILGPSLDVLDSVQTFSGEDLGVTTFGGDPFWVGEMGKAFVQGIHEGSGGKIAVIATHFPGRGGSDRQPYEEIATVRKSLEQLKQVELAPFFSVTGNTEAPAQMVDGLLLSHIRYQGFQGNIRATTKPVSFDAAALELIMSLPQFNGWRDQGGIIVSDELGSEAVRKFFDPLNTGFDARQVARSALLAGNDLLNLGNVKSTNDIDSYTTVVRTIDYFVQRYRDDSAFSQRVDQAVARLLTLKFRLYPEFDLDSVTSKPEELDLVGKSQSTVLEIAQKSVTLINPGIADLVTVLSNPPQFDDRIVFISDLEIFKQCSSCFDQTIFPAETLMNTVSRLYGAGSGDQIQASHMHAYSFDNLRILLERGTDIEAVQSDLGASDWIIFAFTGSGQIQDEKFVFQRLFNERPDLIRNKKIIGLAFNAPYYFDATDISKFTAYYALYSKTIPFFEVASRILFQELIPVGNLPVSVPGIGYDLIIATSPDPNQIIPVNIESPEETGTVVSTPPSGYSKPLQYKAGDMIPIKAGMIVDMNGNPVPDGTVVRFLIDSRSANGTLEQLEMQTTDGMAMVTYTIPSIGSLELRVEADPALTSQILRLDITDAGGVVTAFEPTVSTEESTQVEPTPMATPTQVNKNVAKHQAGELSILDWFVSSVMIIGVCILFNWLARKTLSIKWNAVMTLAIALGGFVAYSYIAAGLPGSTNSIQDGGTTLALIVVLLGMAIGLALGFGIFKFAQRKKKLSQNRDQESDQAKS